MPKIVDKKLLSTYQSKSCVICNAQAEPFHIYASHDIKENILPICRVHIEKIKHLGLSYVVEEHPELELALFDLGWQFDIYSNKWINYEILEL